MRGCNTRERPSELWSPGWYGDLWLWKNRLARHQIQKRDRRHTVAIGILGGVDVDLSEADLAAPEVMITKVSIIGGVSVRVPAGMRVEVSNFSILGGRNSNLGGPLAPNAPVLHIRSFSVIGGVNVRTSRKKRNRDADV